MNAPAVLLLGALGTASPGAATEDLVDRAAEAAELSRACALRLTCVERVRTVHYGKGTKPVRETEKLFHWGLERDGAGGDLVAVRATASGRVVDGPDASFAGVRWPESHAWIDVLRRENRGFFRFEEGGSANDGPISGRRLEFRGAVPYDEGDDVREWVGHLDVEPESGRLLRLEALPSSQLERTVWRYERDTRRTRWSVGLFGGVLVSGRFGLRPRSASATVRFQLSPEGTALPEEVRYEARRWVGRGEARLDEVQIRSYEDCRVAEAESREGTADSVSLPRERR